MGRKYIDCRDVPSEMNCTVTIAADSEEELLEAAVQHGVKVSFKGRSMGRPFDFRSSTQHLF